MCLYISKFLQDDETDLKCWIKCMVIVCGFIILKIVLEIIYSKLNWFENGLVISLSVYSYIQK